RAVDGDRQHHRDRAIEPQAYARLLDDRTHGLHAARPAFRRGRRQLAERRGRLRRGDVLYADLRADVGRRVRHAAFPLAQGLRVREPGRSEGAEPAQSLVRVRTAGNHVFAHRHSADGRLLRQVRRALRRGERRPGLARRGGGSLLADRRVLLPAHRQAHVFRRAEGDRSRDGRRAGARAALGQWPRAASPRAPAAASDVDLLRRDQESLSDLNEKFVSGEDVYRGNLLHVRRDVVRLPDGSQGVREYIRHPGAVMMVRLLGGGRVVLERQFRYPHGREFVELPAGKLEPGEPRLETAKRELLEETGYVAAEWKRLCMLHTAIAYTNEGIELWLA